MARSVSPYPCGFSELFKEPEIILPEIPNVGDAVLEHRHALRPHAEGEAAVDSGIISAVLLHDRMHHARAGDLQPAGVLAHGATFAAAIHALHIHLHARLGEWEVRGAETHCVFSPEDTPGEFAHRFQHVGHAHVLAYRQPLHLLELDVLRCGELLVAVAHAGQDHAGRVGAVCAHGG